MALLKQGKPGLNMQQVTAPSDMGRAGEEAVALFLLRKGWQILDRNWRAGHLELDIVARDHGTVVFVEVKTRAQGGMQRPFEALGLVKKKRLLRAAAFWLKARRSWSEPCRFDLACVTVRGGHYETELMQNVIELGDPWNILGGGNAAWQPW